MSKLETRYLNLHLNNPIIVGSSGLTNSVEKIYACEQAGAGAVVVKSLFEEVLAKEDWGIAESAPYHPEASEYLNAQLELQYGPEKYCDLIANSKAKVKMPVIASINCVSNKWWPQFAVKVENAGADALELNVFKLATDPEQDSQSIEKMYFDILHTVKEHVKIPIAMKIGYNFTSLPCFASNLDKKGLGGLVIFNRFTEPDIDINTLKLKTTFSFSDKDDINFILRWVAILSDKIECDISATTGIHSATGIIKLLLAGAATVQLASVLYKNGLGKIAEMLKELESWMLNNNMENLEQFKGKVKFATDYDPAIFLRAQFMEKIRNYE